MQPQGPEVLVGIGLLLGVKLFVGNDVHRFSFLPPPFVVPFHTGQFSIVPVPVFAG
jgi:hypothetical protein